MTNVFARNPQVARWDFSFSNWKNQQKKAINAINQTLEPSILDKYQ